MRRLTTLLALIVAAGLTAAGTGAAAPLPSRNLVKNPGAELGPATPDSAIAALPVPAWTVSNGFHARGYNAYINAPAQADRTKGSGSKFFVGCFQPPGKTVVQGAAEQTVALGPWAKAIDAGTVALRFSAELGGYDGRENRATAEAVFLDANGTPLKKARLRLAGPTYLQRQGVTRVEPRTATGPVPAGTRQVRIKLGGSGVPCGFVDNVAAVLTPVKQ